ncbi:hypothetical protein Kpho02_07510 [Kitasatospora phosalacinea]|uniref:Uncharacterized protein n=1 Tax=Kitasatospora phosalacinea TaxID=2065 RepID=A0A9W6Q2D4_9ACTN|nr:hypothetical protein [Kitasatospora phosalacinea]GLW68452.1 hypothetical protein Kpho02_07510 [Kitasatospora phosalacinea]
MARRLDVLATQATRNRPGGELDSRERFLSRLREAKWSLLEIIVLAVILSLSINILSSLIFDLAGRRFFYFASIGTITLCLAYSTIRQTKDRQFDGRIGASFIIGPENRPIDLRGYRFSEKFSSLIVSAFSENPALARQWDREPVSSMLELTDEGVRLVDNSGAKLTRELVEYMTLERMATHLTDYFNQAGIPENLLVTRGRADIPDVLLSNRFMELFSRDRSDRPDFPEEGGPANTRTVTAWSRSGGYYSRFGLPLPHKSTVTRGNDGSLRISCPAFKASISVGFYGTNEYIPFDLLKYQAGNPDPRRIKCYSVSLIVKVSANRSFILGGRGWNNHLWVESFIDSLREEFDVEAYIKRINWPMVSAILHGIDCQAQVVNSELATEQEDAPDSEEASSAPGVDVSGAEGSQSASEAGE